jgi:tetratricopeptide (TPR) repeat protein
MIIGMLGIAFSTAKKNRLYSFCILWFLGNLVIESSTIPLEIIFEHRTYLPSMLAILLLVMFFHQIVKKRIVLLACLVSVALLFSYWTYSRNKVWQDDVTLWADCQKKSPGKARVNLNLGVAYLNEDKPDEAIPVLHKALQLYEQEIKLKQNVSARLAPYYFRTLGEAYKKKGEYEEAIMYLNKALKKSSFDGNDVRTYYFLGQCYAEMLRAQEAVYHFSKALQLAQDYDTDVGVQAIVGNIRDFLERAKRLLKAQKERKNLLRNNIKTDE